MAFHLAQVNIARMKYAMNHPDMADFVARIAAMNRLAEQSKGFVWRPSDTEVSPEKLRAFETYFIPFDSERFFYNMSVWMEIDDLKDYVYQTPHSELFRLRKSWMEDLDRASLALWWIPAGHRPTIAESAEKLRSLNQCGPTMSAFTFKNTFQSPQA